MIYLKTDEEIELMRVSNLLVGKTVKEAAASLKLKILIAVVERGDDVFIPGGDFVFEERDIISVVTTHRSTHSFFKKIKLEAEAAKSVMILGGGQATHSLVDMLESEGIDVKIVEKNYDLCKKYADEFENATIINADPSDKDVLREEGLERADSLVSLLDKDEDNILLSVFAKDAGNKKVIARINRDDYDHIIERFDHNLPQGYHLRNDYKLCSRNGEHSRRQYDLSIPPYSRRG